MARAEDRAELDEQPAAATEAGAADAGADERRWRAEPDREPRRHRAVGDGGGSRLDGAATRWVLGALGAVAGFYLSLFWLGQLSQTYPLPLQPLQAAGVAAAGLVVGGLFGHLLGPALLAALAAAFRALEERVAATPAVDLLAGTAGVVVGLIVAYLLSPALARVPWSVRAGVTLLLAYAGLAIFLRKRGDWVRLWSGRGAAPDEPVAAGAAAFSDGRPKILDTSAIIDGRIGDLYETGFLEGRLIVPTSVLDELRHMADSGDELRRQRGRFGLEVLASLQRDRRAPVTIESRDPAPDAEVDSKLVLLAREAGGYVVTTDFNLNKVAELQGVPVLNVNALANALKPRYLVGEEMTVRVVQPGKQPGQGIGYLEDGTMVLIEGGRHLLHADVAVEVTNVIQKQQGRMIFARLRPPADPPGKAADDGTRRGGRQE